MSIKVSNFSIFGLPANVLAKRLLIALTTIVAPATATFISQAPLTQNAKIWGGLIITFSVALLHALSFILEVDNTDTDAPSTQPVSK